ncbi:MAG: lactate utilization protein B/C [Bacteroidetes bacterium]|nr:lactate utilization protein B/C [Bacteroidota bacterium]
MSSRELILKAVAENKPDLTALPEMDLSLTIRYANKIEQFIDKLKSAGATTCHQDSKLVLQNDLTEVKAQGKFIIDLLDIPHSKDWGDLHASQLESLDTCYLRAELGVAENGAMWISEKQMSNRLIPFICQHLVIVINEENIVNTMHEAYQRIETTADGFGVFIAGPSKTADIEQNLVIGAHGSRSLRVYLMGAVS